MSNPDNLDLPYYNAQSLRSELELEGGTLRATICNLHDYSHEESTIPHPDDQGLTITVRCIENLELWINHIASANGRDGELFLRGTRRDYGSNYPQFFRKKGQEAADAMMSRRQALLDRTLLVDSALQETLRSSDDYNERRIGMSRGQSSITEFSQRLAILQHYQFVESIGLDVTKDAKVAASMAFAEYNPDEDENSNHRFSTRSASPRRDDSYVLGYFLPGPLKFEDSEPRIRSTSTHRSSSHSSGKSDLMSDRLALTNLQSCLEHYEKQFVLTDLSNFLPATAKRPRLQKGLMIYRSSDLILLNTICQDRGVATTTRSVNFLRQSTNSSSFSGSQLSQSSTNGGVVAPESDIDSPPSSGQSLLSTLADQRNASDGAVAGISLGQRLESDAGGSSMMSYTPPEPSPGLPDLFSRIFPWISQNINDLEEQGQQQQHRRRESVMEFGELDSKECEGHLKQDAGWDADELCIVKFRIPKEVTFTDFFRCHTGAATMTRKRLMEQDHLYGRLTSKVDHAVAAAIWTRNDAATSSSRALPTYNS